MIFLKNGEVWSFDELNELYSCLQRCHYEEIFYAKYKMEKELQETVEFRIKIMKEIEQKQGVNWVKNEI